MEPLECAVWLNIYTFIFLESVLRHFESFLGDEVDQGGQGVQSICPSMGMVVNDLHRLVKRCAADAPGQIDLNPCRWIFGKRESQVTSDKVIPATDRSRTFAHLPGLAKIVTSVGAENWCRAPVSGD